MIAKSWAIKLATEAARTVLAVDQIIVARQAGGPKPPGPNAVSRNNPPVA
jgi:T-complex protein 1 subunit theta